MSRFSLPRSGRYRRQGGTSGSDVTQCLQDGIRQSPSAAGNTAGGPGNPQSSQSGEGPFSQQGAIPRHGPGEAACGLHAAVAHCPAHNQTAQQTPLGVVLLGSTGNGFGYLV